MPKHLTDQPTTFAVPPRYGLGSTVAAWSAYATGFGVTLPTGLTRNQIITYLTGHGMPVAGIGGTATIGTDAGVNGDLDASTT